MNDTNRFEEATALLERVFVERAHIVRMCMATLDPQLTLDIKDHLRDSAQPVAHTPECMRGQPSAPEPSLDSFFGAIPDLPNPSFLDETLDEARAWQQRAESAESKLEAVRKHVMAWADFPPVDIDTRACVAMNRIFDLLTSTVPNGGSK